ncbi:MAG: YebC/PmpR family DNA-binding transcriptional regulator [Salibacteraceae bacterium]
MGRAFELRKGRKMKRWSAMSKAFTRIGKEITLAAKEGGPSPDNNLRLRMAIQNSKAANMPKDNVERAIKKATDKDMADFKEFVYEGYGPHGIAVLIETATDNSVRTVANVRSYFNKCNGSLGTSGSVEFMFDHKCFFKINPENIDIDELELELIDFGAEEIDGDEEEVMVMGPFVEFGNIQKGLDEKNIEVVESGTDRIPHELKELNEEQRADIDKLLEKIEEDDDVLNVYHNMAE